MDTITITVNRKPGLRRGLRITALILLFLGLAPCLIAFLNIYPVVRYGFTGRDDVTLQLYIPLLCMGPLNGLGLLLLFISFFIYEK
jgi:ABC-type spermidine/putrescine transport system permease subunit II